MIRQRSTPTTGSASSPAGSARRSMRRAERTGGVDYVPARRSPAEHRGRRKAFIAEQQFHAVAKAMLPMSAARLEADAKKGGGGAKCLAARPVCERLSDKHSVTDCRRARRVNGSGHNGDFELGRWIGRLSKSAAIYCQGSLPTTAPHLKVLIIRAAT